MRLSVNLDTHEVTTTPSALKFKGASTEPVEIVFAHAGGSPAPLAQWGKVAFAARPGRHALSLFRL